MTPSHSLNIYSPYNLEWIKQWQAQQYVEAARYDGPWPSLSQLKVELRSRHILRDLTKRFSLSLRNFKLKYALFFSK